MSKENQVNSYEILQGATLDPSSISPTLPPTPTFTISTGPTGNTGSTGDTGPTGNTIHSPLHIDAPHRFLNDHYKKAGVPRIRIHDLRHTHATLMLQAGEHPKIVQDH